MHFFLYCNFNITLRKTLSDPSQSSTFVLFFLLNLSSVHKSSILCPPGEPAPPFLLTLSQSSPSSSPSLLPLTFIQQLELLQFGEFIPLGCPVKRSPCLASSRLGSLVHCVLKQPVHVQEKRAPEQGGPSLILRSSQETHTEQPLY